jgi:hypothetical protein
MVPKVCVAAKGECLFCRAAASLPFSDEYVSGPTCAICAFQVQTEVLSLVDDGLVKIKRERERDRER